MNHYFPFLNRVHVTDGGFSLSQLCKRKQEDVCDVHFLFGSNAVQ